MEVPTYASRSALLYILGRLEIYTGEATKVYNQSPRRFQDVQDKLIDLGLDECEANKMITHFRTINEFCLEMRAVLQICEKVDKLRADRAIQTKLKLLEKKKEVEEAKARVASLDAELEELEKLDGP
jgi:hypothetical protein